MSNYFHRFWPFFVFVILFVGIFYKVFFSGLVPFPSDLLASYYFPYNSGGWIGYTPWITHKEALAADVPRLLFPLKDVVIGLFKNGIMPLWNPYQFSGMPLMANFQSTVFYPLNLLFFLFDVKVAWIMYIMSEPILSFMFMYMFLRSLKLSKYAAFFGGISFPFIGFMQVQFEWGVPTHSALYLPLVLWGITQFFEKKKKVYLLVSSIGIALSIFAGYIQPTTYVIVLSIAYYIFYTFYSKSGVKALFGLWFVLLAIGITAIQLLPSYEGIQLSARNAHAVELFHQFQLPYEHIVTLFAPDFFGHPARGNYWGTVNYAEFMVYFGIVALTLGIFYLTRREFWENKIAVFFFGSGIIALLFALPTPLSEILTKYNVFVLSTGVPARAVFLLQFAMVILASYAIEILMTKKDFSHKVLWIIAGLYGVLWLFVLVSPVLFHSQPFVQYMPIAERNLIFPTIIFFAMAFLFILVSKYNTKKRYLFFVIVLLAVFEHQYFLYNFSPFASLQYIFPTHPLITYLQGKTPPYRVYGYDTARLEVNFPMYWRLYSPEGFDSLYPSRYGEFVYSTYNGQYTTDIRRSDAMFPNTLPANDSHAKKVAFNILSVKYLLDKDDNYTKDWDPQSWRFPQDQYQLIWQKGKWKVYENKQSFPRAPIFYNAKIIANSRDIVNTLFSKDFSYRSTLVLEERPPSLPSDLKSTLGEGKIITYSPNNITISVSQNKSGLLFLSDNYYPGWKAYVDGKETKIYRADFTFRSVVVPKGDHMVAFRYEPVSFEIGKDISIVCIIILAGGFFISFKKRNKK